MIFHQNVLKILSLGKHFNSNIIHLFDMLFYEVDKFKHI